MNKGGMPHDEIRNARRKKQEKKKKKRREKEKRAEKWSTV